MRKYDKIHMSESFFPMGYSNPIKTASQSRRKMPPTMVGGLANNAKAK